MEGLAQVTIMHYRLLILVLAAVAAKKSRNADPDILNPEEETVDPKKSGEYNTDSKFVEGDMVVKGGDKNNRNAVNGDRRLWPGGVVPYEMNPQLPQSLKDLIKRAMGDYHKYTCIKWQSRQSEKNYVYFTNGGGGCYAFLGRYGGRQPVNLGQGCEDKGIAIHEMMHSIGFAHEQSRNNRDYYIRINWQNMKPGARVQFEKMSSERDLRTPYDIKSIMHYGPWGFSANGKRVIETLDPKMKNVIGQRQGFSKIDAEEINKLYRCGSSRPTPKPVPSNIRPEDCKDSNDRYCYDLAVKYGYDTFCNSQMYQIVASKSCPKYCRLC